MLFGWVICRCQIQSALSKICWGLQRISVYIIGRVYIIFYDAICAHARNYICSEKEASVRHQGSPADLSISYRESIYLKVYLRESTCSHLWLYTVQFNTSSMEKYKDNQYL